MPVTWCLKMSEQLCDPDALVTEPWALTTLPLQKECQACPRERCTGVWGFSACMFTDGSGSRH